MRYRGFRKFHVSDTRVVKIRNMCNIAVEIYCEYCISAKFKREINWKVVIISAVDVIFAVDFTHWKNRKAGSRCQNELSNILGMHLFFA